MSSSELLNFKDFSLKDINFKLVLKDLVTFKLKIRDIKKLYKVYKFYKKVIKQKKIKLKYIRMIKPDDVITGIKLYNKYCYTEDITVESLYKYFVYKLKDIEDDILTFTKDPRVIMAIKVARAAIEKLLESKNIKID